MDNTSRAHKTAFQDDIISYRVMCNTENVQTLQRGMNHRLNPHYSVILMSQRSNAPYKDRIYADHITIEYEGHDLARSDLYGNPKLIDQSSMLPSGRPTQNGLFINAVEEYKNGEKEAEKVKVYEKIMSGVWSLKGYFELIDYKQINDGNRNVYRFILRLTDNVIPSNHSSLSYLAHNRVIPSEVKREVWNRDRGECVLCDSQKNLHFDHDLPFSKGGTSISSKNIRLLCMKHNLAKSAKIE